jgi:hypothetical protein
MWTPNTSRTVVLIRKIYRREKDKENLNLRGFSRLLMPKPRVNTSRTTLVTQIGYSPMLAIYQMEKTTTTFKKFRVMKL